jgi:nitrate/nitrite-specific signal transduction histidine kinase
MAVWSNRAKPKYKENMQICLDCPDAIQIPVKLRNTVVRIALLAFSNAIMHSGIIEDHNIKIHVSVEQKEKETILSVTDNGGGVDFEKTPPGFGFDRMRQLTEKINTWGDVKAELQVETGVNQGTKVLLHLRARDN